MTTNNSINNTLPSGWTMQSTAINSLLYASSANTISALATANNSVLVTNGSGVPSYSTTVPVGLTLPQAPITGVTNASNATAGNVGELISSVVLFASGVAILNNTPTNLTSISLTAGDWDVWGNIYFNNSSNSMTATVAWTSTTSATQPDLSLECVQNSSGLINGAIQAPYQRMNVSGTTTLYISGKGVFSGGTATMCGGIYARRAR
jgi:hypothetical protein